MEVIGTVVNATGTVTAELDGAIRTLKQGSPIHAGETIRTSANSNIEIQLNDDSILSQGADASQTIDSYIYNTDEPATSSLVLNMARGTFRMVTGGIAKDNPDGIRVDSPLATIGIRGTGADFDVTAAATKVGVFLYDGLDVAISSEAGTRFLTAVNTILDVLADGTFGEIRSYSDFEKAFFKAAAPIVSIPQTGQYGDDTGDDEDAPPTGDGQTPPDETGGEVDELAGDNTEGEPDQQQGEPQEEVQPLETLVEIFEAVFGTEEEPAQILQDVFEALTGTGAEDQDTGTTQDLTPPQPTETDDEDDDEPEETTTTSASPPAIPTDGDDDGTGYTPSTYGATYEQDGGTGNDTLSGFDSNKDFMRGFAGGDSLSGGQGNDTLFGGAGDDILNGDCDNDLLVGGIGNDSITGGNAADTLWGGAGSDYFKYTSKNQFGDTIKDFQTGIDKIHLTNTDSTIPLTNQMNGNPENGLSFFTSANDSSEVGSGAYADNGISGASNQGFIYDGNGDLWYDTDLGNSGGATLLASIGVSTLANTDIQWTSGA